MAVEFGQSSIKEWLLDTQDRSTIEDVTRHGCVHGTISELIYYHDTSAFYEKYQDEIWDKLENTRADMGLDSKRSAWTGTMKKGRRPKCRRS
jgi:hypothetical protein